MLADNIILGCWGATRCTSVVGSSTFLFQIFFSQGNMDIRHVETPGAWGRRGNTPFSHRTPGVCRCFFGMVGCHMTLCGALTFWNSDWEFCFCLFSSLCKRKNHHDCFATKYLITFLSIQAFFVVLINSFVFPDLRLLLLTCQIV